MLTRRDVDAELEAAVVAASVAGATQPELRDRFALSKRQVSALLARDGIAGGPAMRHIHAKRSLVEDLDLSARERAVVDLVVVQRCGRRQAAAQLGISTRTLETDLKRIAQRLDDIG